LEEGVWILGAVFIYSKSD